MADYPKSIIKLDFVLLFLATSNIRKGGLTFDQILERVKPQIEDGDVLKAIIEKLEKDEYISEYKGSYSITIDGEYFLFLNGYQGELGRLKELADFQKQSSIHQMQSQTKLNELTMWIAGATVTGAAYYLYQLFFGQVSLIDLFYSCHCH